MHYIKKPEKRMADPLHKPNFDTSRYINL